ncbi:MAG: biotin/lipoyl-binding protein, partial [Bacteroidales bacterium]|nr:biotin/lipoyl-binding protein [Bacteroidales bacterium]
MIKASINLKGDFMQHKQFNGNAWRFETLPRVCLLSLICLILLGSRVLIIKNAAAESNESAKWQSVISKTPTKVEVKKIKSIKYPRELVYCGTLEEYESIPLCFSVIGIVSKVFVREGDKVKAGQLLATLDEANYKNLYDMAAAKEKQAEDAYNRLKRMYKNDSLPEVKMIEVETGLKEARSATAIALKNLKSCALYATTDGMIGRKAI